MKKLILFLLVILLTSCSNEISNLENKKIKELEIHVEDQNEYINLLLESNANLGQEVDDLKIRISEYENKYTKENVVIHYDAQVREEDKLMVSLQDYDLNPIPDEGYHTIDYVLKGTLLRIKETANVNHNGVWIKWFRVEAPLYDVAKNAEGWIPEGHLERFDKNDSSQIINVKCIGTVDVYLDNNNELGAKSTIIDGFQGIIVEQREEHAKIALGQGNYYWVNKEDIVLHFTELMN